MSFPAELTNAVDGVTEIVAAHLNNLEAKVGIDSSAVVTSLDYLLKNAASTDPGHKHSKLWASDGSPEAVTVDASGNVGMGTTAPGCKLHIAGDVNYTGTGNQGQVRISGSTDSNYRLMLGYDTTDDFGFITSAKYGAGWRNLSLQPDGGNVGMGTTSPGTKLHVQQTAVASTQEEIARFTVSDDAASYLKIMSSTSVDSVFAPMITGHNGTIYPSLFHQAIIATDTGSLSAMVFDSRLSASAITTRPLFDFRNYGISKVLINAAGNVGIGTTSPGYKLTCNGEPGANGFTAWTNYSDQRLKQNIKPLNGDVLAKILQLNPVTFTYNQNNPWGEKPGERTLYGFIAQELQDLFPDMVGEVEVREGEKYLTTNLSNLNLYLVQAIKEQQAQIEALQGRLN